MSPLFPPAVVLAAFRAFVVLSEQVPGWHSGTWVVGLGEVIYILVCQRSCLISGFRTISIMCILGVSQGLFTGDNRDTFSSPSSQ